MSGFAPIMREIAEFRVLEKYAPRLFADHEGKKLGSGEVRKIEIDTSDPRFQSIGEMQRQIQEETVTEEMDHFFFYGWLFHRKYSEDELKAASCFLLIISAAFEPAGEECGTDYDDTAACPRCGAGSQRTRMRLDLRKTPKSKDIVSTIADEWIVSQRLAERLIDARLTGFELRLVRHKARHEDGTFDLRETPVGREIIRRGESAGAPFGTVLFDIWLNRAENVAILRPPELNARA